MKTISINPPELTTDCGLSVKACRRRQTAASVLYVLGAVIANCLPKLLLSIFSSFYDYSLSFRIYASCSVLSEMFYLLAFALLLKTCSNNASKVGLWVLIGIRTFNIIDSSVSLVIFNQHFISSDIIPISIRISLFMYVLPLYAYSLVFRNNRMDSQLRSWTNLLVVFTVLNPIFWSTHFYLFEEIDFEWQYCVGTTPYSIIGYLSRILLLIAMVKLMRSDVFSGNHREVAEKPYTPLNRYLIGPSIAIVLTFAALWAYYSFAADMVNRIL